MVPLSSRAQAVAAFILIGVAPASAQTGASDDRVSLPDGPGSIDGMGDNASFAASKGSFNYSIPMVVPDGLEGLTPSVALTYDSNGGASLAGIGWSLSTGGSIERMTSRGVPDYDADDLFAVDGGTQLVRVSDGEPAVYRSRFEGSFSRYHWHERGDGDEGYWTEWRADGSISYFGVDRNGSPVESARVRGPDGVFRYLLVETVDTYGDALSYVYQTYDGKPLLDFVGYAHDAGGTPRFAVTFDYEQREDFLSDASGGFNDRLTQRLAGVHIFSSGAEIRSYAIFYEPYGEAGGKSRVARVEQYGQDGSLYPAIPTFTYSRALGGVCDGTDCEEPYLVDMGSLGISLATGNATLIDLNGDALPDVLETPVGAAHRIHFAELLADGTHEFMPAVTTALAATSSVQLSSPYVQPLDYQGDGFTDLLNATTGTVLVNDGSGDWAEEVALGGGGTGMLPDLGEDFDVGVDSDLAHIRFFDYDNDRLIDVMRSDALTTTVFKNLGQGGYQQDVDVAAIGYGFEEDNLELADMNGDGLLDPVVLLEGQVVYRLHLGKGQWAAPVTIENVPVTAAQIPFASFEDLDGDGLDDLVIVQAGTLTYALNVNAATFAAPVSLDEASGQSLPLRDVSVTLLFADMNANGSNDVVWVTSSGDVTYLELFPVRPNLLSRVENGLGQVNEITYATAASQRARDLGVGWDFALTHPSLVVETIDAYVDAATPALQSHDRTTMRYRGGYYDGEEKQFQGFTTVEIVKEAAESQPGGVFRSTYDVGAGGRPAFAGLQLESTSAAEDGTLIETARTTYAACPLAGVDNTGQPFPIVHPCAVRAEYVAQEGRPEAEWVTHATDYAYDGYGNATLVENHGVISIGSGGCPACEASPGFVSGPCGAQCLGDEQLTETTYADPTLNTSGRWLVGLEVALRQWTSETGRERVTQTYYDGADFEGLPLGQVERGNATRIETLTEDGAFALARYAYDDVGDLVEALFPGKSPSDVGGRHRYTWDPLGLNILREETVIEVEGAPRVLSRSYTYDATWNQIASATERALDDDAPAGISRYGYDAFGRLAWIARPGDSDTSPTSRFTYDLGAPYSRSIVETKREPGAAGAYDMESITCYDGLGRLVQRRQKLDDGSYEVTGFTTYNKNGEPIRAYQPYVAAGGECESAEPATPFESYSYDAIGRGVGSVRADGAQTRVEYGPSYKRLFSEDDLDADAVGFNTPDLVHTDGLGRVVRVERTLSAGGDPVVHRFGYDDLGRLAQYIDPEGNERRQTHDLLERIVELEDPDAGHWQYAYDDEGNPVRQTDPAGNVVLRAFDDLGRLTEEYIEGQRDSTLVEVFYDAHPTCTGLVCTNLTGRLAGARFATELGTVERALAYNPRGEVTATMETIAGVTYRTEHEMNNAGDLVATTLPDGRRVTMELDRTGRVVAIPGYVSSITHTVDGFLEGFTLANGVRTTYTYDGEKQLASIRAGEGVVDLTYERNVVFQITGITDGAATGKLSSSAELVYDALTRLLSAEVGEGAEGREVLSWVYDDLERVTQQTSSDASSPAHLGTFDYDPMRPRALVGAGDASYGYDAAGRVTERGAQNLEWNGFGRLSRVRGSGVDQRIVYAGTRRLAELEGGRQRLHISPSYEVNDGVARLKLRLGGDIVLYEDSTAMTAEIVGDEDGDGAISAADALSKAGEAQRLALRAAARSMLVGEEGVFRSWLHSDHNGSVIAVTDDEGEVTERFSYYPNGQIRESSAVESERAVYARAAHDRTGLLDMGSRTLMPEVGRFTSPDMSFVGLKASSVTRLPDTAGVYTYAANDPVSSVDAGGGFEWTPGKIAVAALAVTVLGFGIAAGCATGILPAAAVAVVAIAGTVAGLVGAIVGGITGLIGGIAEGVTKIQQIKRQGKKPDAWDYGFAVLGALYKAFKGTVSGAVTSGVTAVIGGISSAIKVQENRDKIHPRDSLVARTALGFGEILAGDLSGLAPVAAAATATAAAAFNGATGVENIRSYKKRYPEKASYLARAGRWLKKKLYKQQPSAAKAPATTSAAGPPGFGSDAATADLVADGPEATVPTAPDAEPGEGADGDDDPVKRRRKQLKRQKAMRKLF